MCFPLSIEVEPNVGGDISWSSNLVSESLRCEGFSNDGLSFWELITDTWSKIDRMSTLTKFILLWSAANQHLN